jgi:hypothetical protein
MDALASQIFGQDEQNQMVQIDDENEVTNERLKECLVELAELIDAESLQAVDCRVPRDAFDYIGKERSLAANKANLVMDLGWRLTDQDSTDRVIRRENMFSRMIKSSTDPLEMLALIARIWKYLEISRIEKTKNQADPRYFLGLLRFGPGNFLRYLEAYYKREGLEPLNVVDEQMLADALKRIEERTPVDQVINVVNFTIQRQLNYIAPPETMNAYQAAQYKGVNRGQINVMVQRMIKMREYLLEVIERRLV